MKKARSKKKTKPLDYPDVTTGSKALAQVRPISSALSPEEADVLFRKAMVMIYGAKKTTVARHQSPH